MKLVGIVLIFIGLALYITAQAVKKRRNAGGEVYRNLLIGKYDYQLKGIIKDESDVVNIKNLRLAYGLSLVEAKTLYDEFVARQQKEN